MILVTGGTGLIGGEVLRRLSERGVLARALTRDPKKAQNMPGVSRGPCPSSCGRRRSLR